MINNDLKINEFSYELPNEKIAFFPKQERDTSKLLIYRDGKIAASIFKNLASELPKHAHLIFNNTRVIEARLHFVSKSGAQIEVFCLEPAASDISTALATTSHVVYKCLVGKASKWKTGEVLSQSINGIELSAVKIEQCSDGFLIEFRWNTGITFIEVLHLFGKIPLPPYIKRSAETSDAATYQTIYANENGSVAAPTAGLHFTQSVLTSLQTKEIETGFVTLHVGAGTFMPVKTEKISDHIMHSELIEVRIDFLRKMLLHFSRITVAVGTTSLRTLESLFWLGYLVQQNPGVAPQSLEVPQWLPYETEKPVGAQEAIECLIQWMENKNLEVFFTKTRLLIMPGYRFRIVKALITNFHQPGSTLLLLIAAFVGNDWRKIYDYALTNDFRFLSYGDSSLLFLNDAI